MIGKQIKVIIDKSDLSYTQVADKLDISYQYLFKIFNKESVETRYLFGIAKILNLPVTVFFEDEPGGIIPAFDGEKLMKENDDLKRKVDKLEKEKDNLNLLIEYIKKHDLIDAGAVDYLKNTGEKRVGLEALYNEMRKNANVDGLISQNKINDIIKLMNTNSEI